MGGRIIRINESHAAAQCSESTADEILRINLRAAAAADDREEQIARLIQEMSEARRAGHEIEIVWPSDRQLPIFNYVLGIPLANHVIAVCENRGPRLTIHTRTGKPADFINQSPRTQIDFVFHVNSEEAALRWERDDPAPMQRVAAGIRLRNEKWNVRFSVGPVRLFPHWREEYVELVTELFSLGLDDFLISFAENGMTAPASAFAEAPSRHTFETEARRGISDKRKHNICSFLCSAAPRAA